MEDARARREARGMRLWWRRDRGMLRFGGELPDIEGARFEAAVNRRIERMRPPKGQPWDSREHRMADAVMDMCDESETAVQPDTPVAAPKPLLVVAVPLSGPAEVAGIPLPDAMVEQLRANARIEPVLVDDDGIPIAVSKQSTVLSPKIARAVLLRDGHCRIPGCEHRHGLEVHHLRPRSWGGSDALANLAAVCRSGGHHGMLVPTGKWALVGNPNQPDGLKLKRLDELGADEALQLGLPPPRRRAG